MWAKLGNWFKNFFKSITADPQSTISGIGKLAAAGGAAYGMATGAVPVTTATVTATAGLATSGLVSLGTNHNTGEVNPTIQKIADSEESLATTAQTIDPIYKGVKDAIDKAGEAASTAAKIQAATTAIQQITSGLPQVSPPQDKQV